LDVSVDVVVVSIGFRVVRLLPAAVWLGVVVWSGCLYPRIFCM